MILIILSLVLGYVGLIIGRMFGAEIFAYLCGLTGFFGPGLYVLFY